MISVMIESSCSIDCLYSPVLVYLQAMTGEDTSKMLHCCQMQPQNYDSPVMWIVGARAISLMSVIQISSIKKRPPRKFN